MTRGKTITRCLPIALLWAFAVSAAPPAGMPEGINDAFTVDVNKAANLNVVANDRLNGSLAPLSINSVSPTVAASPCPACGEATSFSSNQVTFQSNGLTGDAVFFYLVEDAAGNSVWATCDGYPAIVPLQNDSCAVVTVTVTYIADVPNLTVSSNVLVDEDSSVNLGIAAAVSDALGSETLSLSISGLPPGASISDGTNSSGLPVTDVTTWTYGDISVTPAADDHTDFVLTVTATSTTPNADSAQALEVINVVVNAINDPPVPTADAYGLNEGATVSGTGGVSGTGVLGNDTDVDGDALTVALVSAPNHASSFVLNADGSFTYQHDDTENFTDSFTYTVSDGTRTSGAATASLTVNELNDNVSVASGDFSSIVVEGNVGDPAETASGSISISDVDMSDTPSFADISIAGTYGNLVLASGGWTYTLDQSAVQGLDAGDAVSDVVTLTATDLTTHDLTITVNGTNDAPTVNDQAVTVPENSAGGTLVVPLGALDLDIDDTLTYTVTGGISAPAEFEITAAGDLVVGAHTPDIELLNFEQTPFYALDILVSDSQGASDTATITINLTDESDPPGVTVCEEFDTDGTPLNVLPTYLAPLRSFYSFTQADPCHRVIDSSDDYFMDQSKKLVATDPIPDPQDTALINYRGSLSEIPRQWDQDSLGLHFDKKQAVTTLLATVAFTDEGGAITDTGEFVYEPPANVNASDDGLDHFVYQVCDDPMDQSEAHCALGVVYVNIEKTAQAGVTTDNVLAGSNDLSQGPLELPVPALPNVFVLLDDSEAMSSDILTTESEGYYAVGNQTKTYFLPEDGSGKPKYADSEQNRPGRGLWRLRNHNFNKVYYNPSIRYTPWIGVDDRNQAFAPADPTAAISDPFKTSSAKIDLTSTHNMPNRDRNLYLARYYDWTDIDDPANCPANVVGVVDGDSPHTDPGGTCTEGTLVEIKPGYAGGSDTYPKAPGRTDCAGLLCTYAEEIQNFANFYSYARTRHYASKSSLGSVIAAAENMRIGFGAFGGTNDNINISLMNESPYAGNKSDLLERLYRNNASSNSTPIRDSLERTGRYFACENSRTIITSGATCPVLPAPEGNCQQNFSLVVTAGFWNGSGPSNDIGNDDAGSSSDFDGGRYADSASQTLADVAMYFYERDLHPGLANEVPATTRDLEGAPDTAFSGSSGAQTMHQHMSTYVIAFGVNGTVSIDDVPDDYTTPFSWGDALTDEEKLNDLVHTTVNGRGDYLNANNPAELDAALEEAFSQFAQAVGTASAVSFNSQEIQEDLNVYRAFYNIRENTGDLVAQELNEDNTIGATVWSAADRLDLKSWNSREILTFDPTVVSGAGGIPFRAADLNAEQQLALEDDPDGTQVDFSTDFDDQIDKHVRYLRGDASDERPLGNLRERPAERGRLGDIVSSTPVFYGAPSRPRRGSPPYPQAEPYADFKATYQNRTEAIYVASNDGMVHGFDAEEGDELFAYVPDHIITGSYSQRIKQLLSTNYVHRYLVDLSVSVNDVYLDPVRRAGTISSDKRWLTMLVGGYRAGGKGYFALDITNPDLVTEANAADVVMWEFTDEDDIHPTSGGVPLLDANGYPLSDLGYTFSPPTLAMSNASDTDTENRWVAVFGNGYNSSSGRAALFVLFADGGTDGEWCHPQKTGCAAGEYDFIKIDTPAVDPSIPNGLGTPRGIDMDGNGTVDIVYAGDRFGNLYRFDLRNPDPTTWDATLLFQAEYDNTVTMVQEAQPISSQPLVVVHPTKKTGANCYTYNEAEVKVDSLCGGYIIVFGTGSYIFSGDDTATDIQSMYGIWDRLGATVVQKSDLVRQEYTSIEGDSNVGDARVLSANPVDYDTQFGWYNDLEYASEDGLIDPLFPGEKAIRNMQMRGGIVFVNSVMPKAELSCTTRAGGAANAFCPDTGTLLCREDISLFDVNGDNVVDDSDKTSDGQVIASTYFEDSVPTDSTFIGGNRVTQLSDQSLEIRLTDTSRAPNTGRISWTRLQQE